MRLEARKQRRNSEVEISSICPAVCPSAGQRGSIHENHTATKVVLGVALGAGALALPAAVRGACAVLLALHGMV